MSPSAMESPNLGHEATPAQIAGWDISVGPDGVGLPPGKGTPATGATVYEQKCQVCHGAKGAGQPNDRLVGGQGTLTSKAPVRTIGSYWPYATTVFDYVRRSMPYIQPQSLSDDEVYAVTAYLLNLNGIIGENDGDERADVAEGEDAQPAELHPRVSVAGEVASALGDGRSPSR